MSSAVIFDTETTGLVEPEVIEIAWMPIAAPDFLCHALDTRVQRFRPSKPISLGAMATHHIMDEDLLDEPPSSEARLPGGVDYVVGYNVDFDWRAVGCPEVKRIDLLPMCRALWPGADSYSLGAMLYLLLRPRARFSLTEAHSARADVRNTWWILRSVLERIAPVSTMDELWEASERMRVPTHMPFGKHRGVPIAELPADYRAWLVKQADLDPYLARALAAR